MSNASAQGESEKSHKIRDALRDKTIFARDKKTKDVLKGLERSQLSDLSDVCQTHTAGVLQRRERTSRCLSSSIRAREVQKKKGVSDEMVSAVWKQVHKRLQTTEDMQSLLSDVAEACGELQEEEPIWKK